MLKFLAVSAIVVGAQLQFGAKAMFYNPGNLQQVSVEPFANAQPGLRPIVFARPFPSDGHVGIHYWFEDGHRMPFSERLAANEAGSFTLRIRTNVDGFLTAWAIESDNDPGVELTTMQGQHHGHRVAAGAEFAVPVDVRFTASQTARRLLLVFSRAQQEQVGSAGSARNKLDAISRRAGQNGAQLVGEADDTTPGQIGTYVVNQDGGPVAAEILLRSR